MSFTFLICPQSRLSMNRAREIMRTSLCSKRYPNRLQTAEQDILEEDIVLSTLCAPILCLQESKVRLRTEHKMLTFVKAKLVNNSYKNFVNTSTSKLQSIAIVFQDLLSVLSLIWRLNFCFGLTSRVSYLAQRRIDNILLRTGQAEVVRPHGIFLSADDTIVAVCPYSLPLQSKYFNLSKTEIEILGTSLCHSA